MELIVRPARGGDKRYRLLSLLAETLSLWLFHGGTAGNDDRYAPAVIARTHSGATHILQRTGTERQARRARDQLQKELDRMGEAEFRRRYRLPPESA